MSEPDGSAAIDQALAQLGHPEPEARVRAVRWLRVIGGPQAVAAIQGALDDPEEEVRARAAIALGQMEAREVVPSLIEQLKSSPSDEAREICVFALAQISDPRAVPPLIHALQDPSERVIIQICAALAKFGDPPQATESLLHLVDHPSWSVRRAACGALLRLAAADERVAAVLERFTQAPEVQEDRPLLLNMERSLARLRSTDGCERRPSPADEEQRQKAFEMALSDPDARVRSGAVLRLGRLGAQQALPALAKHLLHDESGTVRALCAWRLLELGGEGVADALLQALADSVPGVLMAASMGAAKVGDGRAIPPLRHLLDHPDRNVRHVASRALLTLRAVDQRVVSTLEELAQDPEAEEHDLEVDEWNCDRGARGDARKREKAPNSGPI
jgi:HEAT repeat protein